MCNLAIRSIAIALALVAAQVAFPTTRPDSSARPQVTAVLDFDQPNAGIPREAVHQELNRILAPTGIEVTVKIKGEPPESASFGALVVFKMKGSCTMNALPVGALSDERGALAMTHSVDGQMLSFGEVECDRVRGSLRRVL